MRICVFFLAMLQQVMPSGMCLCQAFPWKNAAPVRVASELTTLPESSGAKYCHCCAGRHTPESEEPTSQPNAPKPPVDPARPCCPAVFADSHQGLPGTHDLGLELTAVQAIWHWTIDTPKTLVERAEHATARPDSGVPLFISFCALTI